MSNITVKEEDKSNRFTDFVNKIQEKISNLTTLEIKTIVGEYTIENSEDVVPLPNVQFMVMHSKIDLIGGDITTNMSRSMMSQEYAWVREFHAEKERKAHQIVQDNLKAIMSLYELYNQTKTVKIEEKDTIPIAEAVTTETVSTPVTPTTTEDLGSFGT